MAAASGQSERPIATALLLLANVIAVQFAPMAVFWIHPRGAAPMFWTLGILLGQLALLAFWFSLSQLPIRYRTAAVLLTIPLSNAISQFGFLIAPWQLLRSPWHLLVDHFSDRRLWNQTVTGTALSLAFLLAIYTLLLPFRRLRGISLGVRDPSLFGPLHKRQFTMREWMIWAAIAGLPIVLCRWAIADDDGFLLTLYFGSVVAAVALLIGAAFFSASLCGFRSLVAMPLALAFVLAVAWLGTEGAYQLPGFPRSGPPIEFRMAITVITGAWIAIGLNNLTLQCFGVRLHVARRQPQAERVPA